MANKTQQSVHSGDTVYLMANGHVIGLAQSVSGERQYGTTGVYGIGSIMPQEHVYLRYEGTVTLNRFRLKRESLDQLGLAALGEDILQKGVIDIVVMDNLTRNVIIAYRGCTIESMSEDFSVGEIASENSTWAYLTATSVN